MKNKNLIILMFVVGVLMVSFVSAGWFSDIFNGKSTGDVSITGNAGCYTNADCKGKANTCVNGGLSSSHCVKLEINNEQDCEAQGGLYNPATLECTTSGIGEIEIKEGNSFKVGGEKVTLSEVDRYGFAQITFENKNGELTRKQLASGERTTIDGKTYKVETKKSGLFKRSKMAFKEVSPKASLVAEIATGTEDEFLFLNKLQEQLLSLDQFKALSLEEQTTYLYDLSMYLMLTLQNSYFSEDSEGFTLEKKNTCGNLLGKSCMGDKGTYTNGAKSCYCKIERKISFTK